MIKLFVVTILLQFAYSHGLNIQPRIINGYRSNPEDFKFFARVVTFFENSPLNGLCGSSLISDSWVLSAAHCFTDAARIEIWFGVDAKGDFIGTVPIPFENLFIHPEYVVGTDVKDVAVVRLPRPIPPNARVQPVALPTDCGAYLWTDDEYVMVIGNGRTSEKDSDADMDSRLRHAFLHTVPTKQCAAMTPESLPGSVLCSLPTNGQSTFRGDSGGPVIRQSDGVLIGHVSGGRIESKGFFFKKHTMVFQVFTNFHFHFDWIANVTGLNLPRCGHPTFDLADFIFP